MSEREPGREPEPVDETDEPAKLYVSDPDDYAKTRKLKALNDAKAHVRKLRNDRPAQARKDEWEGLNSRLAEAVASYGHELLPLLEAAEEAGTIGDGDYYTNAEKVDIRRFIMADGRVESADGSEFVVPAKFKTMVVYRHLQRLERELGLGLDLEADDNNEWEIQT